MQVSSITCYCKGTSSSDFLKESDYEATISKLESIKTEFESSIDTLDGEMASGQGLSAECLNFDGFSPLFEMGYYSRANAKSAISSIDSLTSTIRSDANTHMTNEWSKYYREISKDIEELTNSLSGLDEKKDADEIKSINDKIEEHKEKLSEAETSLIAVGGKSAPTNALTDAVSELKNPQSSTTIDSSQIEEYIKNNSAGGSWATYAKNLKTGEILDINGNDSMISASVIKLYIMGAAYDAIDQDPSLKSEIEPYISDMISRSDNDATNHIIDVLGMDRINGYIQANGYTETSLNRKMLAERTTENYTSAKDVANFLEKVYNNEMNHSEEMLGHLKAQERTSKIPAGVPSGVQVANKTGELDNVENDAAIVYGGGDYVIVVLSEDVEPGTAQETVRGISSMVYKEYNNDNE